MPAMAEHAHTLAVVASAVDPDPRVAPAAARRLGFNGLQFDAVSTGIDLTALSQTGRREFRHVLAAQDQQLVSLRVDLGARGLGPGADVDRTIERLDVIMDAARGLAAPLVCVDVGPLPRAVEPPRPKPKVTQDMAGLLILPTAADVQTSAEPEDLPAPSAKDAAFASQVDTALIELGRRADRYGVQLAFRSDLASYASVERALGAARCPYFGVDLDPAAVLRDGWDLDEVFSRLGPDVRHVRGRDAVAGPDRRTKPAVIGRGDTKWDHLLSNLDAAGYHGPITVDPLEFPDRAGAAVAAVKYLKLHGVA
jgi:sugar phosphate isomerase/epimerase